MKMKVVLQETLAKLLDGKTYLPEVVSTWTKDIADEIKVQLKGNYTIKKIYICIILFKLNTFHIIRRGLSTL